VVVAVEQQSTGKGGFRTDGNTIVARSFAVAGNVSHPAPQQQPTNQHGVLAQGTVFEWTFPTGATLVDTKAVLDEASGVVRPMVVIEEANTKQTICVALDPTTGGAAVRCIGAHPSPGGGGRTATVAPGPVLVWGDPTEPTAILLAPPLSSLPAPPTNGVKLQPHRKISCRSNVSADRGRGVDSARVLWVGRLPELGPAAIVATGNEEGGEAEEEEEESVAHGGGDGGIMHVQWCAVGLGRDGALPIVLLGDHPTPGSPISHAAAADGEDDDEEQEDQEQEQEEKRGVEASLHGRPQSARKRRKTATGAHAVRGGAVAGISTDHLQRPQAGAVASATAVQELYSIPAAYGSIATCVEVLQMGGSNSPLIFIATEAQQVVVVQRGRVVRCHPLPAGHTITTFTSASVGPFADGPGSYTLAARAMVASDDAEEHSLSSDIDNDREDGNGSGSTSIGDAEKTIVISSNIHGRLNRGGVGGSTATPAVQLQPDGWHAVLADFTGVGCIATVGLNLSACTTKTLRRGLDVPFSYVGATMCAGAAAKGAVQDDSAADVHGDAVTHADEDSEVREQLASGLDARVGSERLALSQLQQLEEVKAAIIVSVQRRVTSVSLHKTDAGAGVDTGGAGSGTGAVQPLADILGLNSPWGNAGSSRSSNAHIGGSTATAATTTATIATTTTKPSDIIVSNVRHRTVGLEWMISITARNIGDHPTVVSLSVVGSAAVYGARFLAKIHTRGCHWFPRMCVTNGILLGCPLLLPVDTVNCFQTPKATH
jgi:hypothetical protein